MKKLIAIDAMGVIYKTGDDVKYLLFPFLKALDPTLTFERVNSLYMKLSLGEITSEELFKSLGFGAQFPQIENDYLDSRLELREGFISAAQALAGKYDLAMLSNDAGKWSKYLRKKFGLDKYFTASVISGDVGVRKPSHEIYRLLLDAAGREAKDCVFIDDSVKNLEAAEECGLHTILFCASQLNDGWEGYSISSFSELHAILKKIFP